MKLAIATDDRKFFRQILEVLHSFPPLDKLRNKELDVLSSIMYYNYLYKDLEEDVRWRVINNKITRKEIREYIGMKEDVFNNNLSVIRKTGLIDNTGRLATMLQIFPGDTYKIEFNFNIEKNVLR